MADCSCLACSIGVGIACKETEARIRANQRAFDLGELQATVRDLDGILDRIADDGMTDDCFDALRAHVRRLTVQPPTEPPGEPSAKLEGPQAGLPGHVLRRIEQLEARNDVLQEEVRRLRALLNAKDAA